MLFKDHFNRQLREKIKTCNLCKLKDQPGPVLGYGGLDADIMFIGEAPKEGDVSTGIPFTGIAKERMVAAIKNNELKKDEYYFTYLVKHQITEGSTPNSIDHKPCFDMLLEEIELINPRIICSMGFYVTKFLMRTWKLEEETTSMKDLCGNGYIVPAKTFYKGRYKKREDNRPKRYLIPTWSPAVEDLRKNDLFKTDVQTIKHVRKLGILLFD